MRSLPTWYSRNRDKSLAYQRARRAADPARRVDECKRAGKRLYDKKRAIVTAFKDRPCQDCELRFHSCQMDLDHVRGTKLFNVGATLKGISYEAIEVELAKCDVVCSNCHRLRTWNKTHVLGLLTAET